MGKQEREANRVRRAAAQAAARRRIHRRNRILASAGGLVVVGLIVAIVVSLATSAGHRSAAKAPSGAPVRAPAVASAGGALVLGNASAPVRVGIFLDYMCPYCGRFERANGADVDRLVADGTVRLELYPLSLLDRLSHGTRYSTRAANAVATVAARTPERVQAFSAALFAHQPTEGTEGLSDAEIASIATGAGVPSDVAGQFTEGIYQPWVVASTNAVLSSGLTGTPVVTVNGVRFDGDLYTAGTLARAVAAAAGR